MKNVVFIFILLWTNGTIYCQHQIQDYLPQEPKPFSFEPKVPIRGQISGPSVYQPAYGNERMNRQNFDVSKYLDDYNREKMARERMINQITAEFEMERRKANISYTFPHLIGVSGTEHYYMAQEELIKMAEGMIPLDLKRAIFVVENAFSKNELDYEWYNAVIERQVDIIKKYVVQSGYKSDNLSAKMWALHQFLTDTIEIKDENGNLKFKNYPYKYDFDDPMGKQNWTMQFVTKLISSGKGQCHSMPLYYLILAEELGVDAWLAYSPSHSYIKVKNAKGNMLNYETTNGHFVSDAWIQSGGYIKAEALRSKIYMDTLSRKQVLASMLADMAKGYGIKYGLDNFVLDCLNRALKYHPNNIYALSLKADYLTSLVNYVLPQLKIQKIDQILAYPEAYKIYQAMHDNYDKI